MGRVYRHWTFSPGSDAASEQTQGRGLNHQHKGLSGEGWATKRCYDMVSNAFPESGIEQGWKERPTPGQSPVQAPGASGCPSPHHHLILISAQ